MKKEIVAAAFVIMAANMIAGCGGGGMSGTATSTTSSSTTSTSSGTTSLSGAVADGYLANATVFMDKNNNYQLDAGEPSTTTDATGAYTLNVDPADVGKYPIVAMAIQGVTTDLDTNQTVTSSYVMSMPKDAVTGSVSGNFISPMSSQLRELMATGKYATMQQAMEDLRQKLHLPAGTNMMSNYMASHNTAMHTAAHNMATLMGGQMPQVFGLHSSVSRMDVNRYRGMMGTIFTNMSSIKAGPDNSAAMSTLMTFMMSNLANIQPAKPGMPFRNMSTSFRGMMGGSISSLMGSGMGSTMGSGTGSGMGSGMGMGNK